jgi:hypothetical protein
VPGGGPSISTPYSAAAAQTFSISLLLPDINRGNKGGGMLKHTLLVLLVTASLLMAVGPWLQLRAR